MGVMRATPAQLEAIRRAKELDEATKHDGLDQFWLVLAELGILMGYSVVRDYLDGKIDEDTLYKLYTHAKIVQADERLDAVLAARMANAKTRDFEKFIKQYQEILK